MRHSIFNDNTTIAFEDKYRAMKEEEIKTACQAK